MCSLDRIKTPGYLYEAETKIILERFWYSVTQPTAMAHIAWKEDFQTTLGTCGMGSSRPGAVTQHLSPAPVLPDPGIQTPGWHRGLLSTLTVCTGRHPQFPNPFVKDTFSMSGMWLLFWKTTPHNSKAGTLCSGPCQSLTNNFFCLPPAIPPGNGQNCAAGHLSSCLPFRRAFLFLPTCWYFHLNCIAPSRWPVTWQT